MDKSLVVDLNHWLAASSIRANTDRIVAVAPLFVIAGLVVLAWLRDWGGAPERRGLLVIGVLGALLALALNVAIGHLYYRPRPFVVLRLHPLLPQHPDSSFYSDQLCIAGALTAGLFLTRRWLGTVALLLSITIAIARVGAGVHYPSDVGIGLVIGAVCFALLLPLRHRLERLISVTSSAEQSVIRRERGESNFLLRHGPFFAVGLLLVSLAIGFGLRTLQDHGAIAAGDRQASMLRQLEGKSVQSGDVRAVPPEFPRTSITTVASGGYRSTHAAIVGDVTEVLRELDGDVHIRIEGSGAFMVAEIIPELAVQPPHVGQRITAWGIVRHDGLHNWWELHPLVGWQQGALVGSGNPGPGVGD